MKEDKKMKNLPEIQENSKGFENKWIVEETHMPFRNYKDRVFRMIFKEKKEFLELYNAMNGTDYKTPEDLIVTTLENAIYLGMKMMCRFWYMTSWHCMSTSQQRIRICRCEI